MKWKLGATAFTVALMVAPQVWAAEFYAHPLNPGVPTDLPGETLIPGLPQTLTAVNSLTQPLIQPILAPDASEAPSARPTHHASRHHLRATAHLRGHQKVAVRLHHRGTHHAA